MKIRKILKWLACIVVAIVIIVIGLIVFLMESLRVNISECVSGPLASIENCEKDHTTYNWMSTGWWYTDAAGPLKPEVCSQIKQNSLEVTLNVEGIGKKTLQKIECSILGIPKDKICYATQRFAGNGNSRFMSALISDVDCKKARYFEGSKVALLNSKPARVENWSAPFASIPEAESY